MTINNQLAYIHMCLKHQKYVSLFYGNNKRAKNARQRLKFQSRLAGYKWNFNVLDSELLIHEEIEK